MSKYLPVYLESIDSGSIKLSPYQVKTLEQIYPEVKVYYTKLSQRNGKTEEELTSEDHSEMAAEYYNTELTRKLDWHDNLFWPVILSLGKNYFSLVESSNIVTYLDGFSLDIIPGKKLKQLLGIRDGQHRVLTGKYIFKNDQPISIRLRVNSRK